MNKDAYLLASGWVRFLAQRCYTKRCTSPSMICLASRVARCGRGWLRLVPLDVPRVCLVSLPVLIPRAHVLVAQPDGRGEGISFPYDQQAVSTWTMSSGEWNGLTHGVPWKHLWAVSFLVTNKRCEQTFESWPGNDQRILYNTVAVVLTLTTKWNRTRKENFWLIIFCWVI